MINNLRAGSLHLAAGLFECREQINSGSSPVMHRCATGSINATFAHKDFYAQLEWMMSVVSGNYSESQGFILTSVNSCFMRWVHER